MEFMQNTHKRFQLSSDSYARAQHLSIKHLNIRNIVREGGAKKHQAMNMLQIKAYQYGAVAMVTLATV